MQRIPPNFVASVDVGTDFDQLGAGVGVAVHGGQVERGVRRLRRGQVGIGTRIEELADDVALAALRGLVKGGCGQRRLAVRHIRAPQQEPELGAEPRAGAAARGAA